MSSTFRRNSTLSRSAEVRFGYHRVCLNCPASLICLTEKVERIFIEGDMHLSPPSDAVVCQVLYFNVNERGLLHCPFARRKRL